MNLEKFDPSTQIKMMGYVPLIKFEKPKRFTMAEREQMQNSSKGGRKNRAKAKRSQIERLIMFTLEKPESSTNRPSSREGATFLQYKHWAYFFGGFTSNLNMKDIWRLDTKKFQWELINNTFGAVPDVGRYGHSINLYNKEYLVIFGGQMKVISTGKQKNYCDIKMLNLKTL